MKTSCSFAFGFVDVTARGDAQLAVTQNQSFARIADINSEDPIAPPKTITLEPDFGCPLDGSAMLLPDDAAATPWGLWSLDLCGENGVFEHVPTLTVQFVGKEGAVSAHSSAGLTFTFVATLPRVLDITWYGREGAVLARESFVPDAFTYFCDRQVEDYSRIEIRVPAMSYALRYLRITRLLFGSLELLDATRICTAVLCEELDASLLTLPISTLELSFFTPNGRFSLLDPRGAYKMFQWKQEIKAQKSLDDTHVPLGFYYLQEAQGAVDALTKIACVDMLGVLDAIEYDGGLYEAMPLASLLADILEPEGFACVIDPYFAETTLSGYLPIGTKREALWQIAFAIGALLHPTRSEFLQVLPLPTQVAQEIAPSRKLLGHTVKLEKLVTQVDVSSHQYKLTEDGNKELQRVDLAAGEHKITFQSPVQVSAVDGATLVQAHPNFCLVRVDTAREVTVRGRDYEDCTTVHTAKLAHLPAGAKMGTERVDGATLLDPEKAQAAAQRLYDYHQNRYTDEGGLLPGTAAVGALLALQSLGGKTLEGYAQRIVTDLHGGALETLSLRGR